jgi:hypothetical protein
MTPRPVDGFYVPTVADVRRYQDMAVVIMTPCGGYESHGKFMQSVVNMVAYSWMHGLRVYQMGITQRTVVDWARNDLARLARDNRNEYTGEKFTHVLWLDDDHVFNPDLAVYLAALGDLDMVSALYYGRADQHLPVVYVKGNDTEDEYKHYPLVMVPDALVEVDAVGFGALLMRRDVLDTVPEPYFTIDYRAGEDIAFCRHAKKCGVKIWLDGRYKLGHIGPPRTITVLDYKRFLEENADMFKDRVRVDFP